MDRIIKYNYIKLLNAIETFGEEKQKIKLFEEMAELQKEVCKNMLGSDNEELIIGEIADVFIMLEQLIIMYGIKNKEIQDVVDFKLNRLGDYIKEHKEKDKK